MMAEPQSRQEGRMNPWELRLENQGLSFNIPDRLKAPPEIEGLQIDRLTGLAIEDNKTRIHVATKFSNCLREGKNWTAVYGDIDNLKVANTEHGRPFGDMVIRHGAAIITQAIERATLSPEAEVITLRQAQAGDEIMVWIFDLSDEEIARIQEEIKITENTVKIDDPKFVLSLSAACVSSKDPRVQQGIKDTQRWLNQNDERIAFNMYQELVEIVDNDVKLAKIEKDLSRLENIPEQELLTTVNMKTFIETLTTGFGNSRISDRLLEVLLKLTSAQTVIAMTNSPQARTAYTELLKGVGVTEEQIKSARTPGDLLIIFRDIFGPSD